MAVLAKLKRMNPLKNLPHGTARSGFKGLLIDKGTRYGAAFGFGAAKGYYGERFLWKGHGADLWIGVGALLVGAGMESFSGGRSRLAPTLERIGDAGVMSALGSIGAAWGMDQAGRSVHVSTPGKNALSAAKSTVLGHIPQAMGGAYLSPDEIQRFAARR
jgi:hypothetical protein